MVHGRRRRSTTNGGAVRRPGWREGVWRARPAARAAALGLLLLLLPAGAAAQAEPAALDDARATLEQWVETRRILSAEKRDGALATEMLGERIALVRREIEGLRARLTEAEASIAEADAKRAELEAQAAGLLAVSEGLLQTVTALEARVRELLARVPDPIRERVRPLSQRLPDPQAENALGLGERFQNVVGILNELDKFNREVTVTSEVRTLPDGTPAEVTALYVGLGAGFYVTGDGRSAGVGRSTAQGWEWRAIDEAAADVAAAVAIVKNEQVARFVRLPLRVD